MSRYPRKICNLFLCLLLVGQVNALPCFANHDHHESHKEKHGNHEQHEEHKNHEQQENKNPYLDLHFYQEQITHYQELIEKELQKLIVQYDLEEKFEDAQEQIMAMLPKAPTEPLKIACSKQEEKLLAQIREEFGKDELKIVGEPMGPDKALKAILSETIDVYIGTMDLPKDLDASLLEHNFAKDGIVLIGNKSNELSNLSSYQIKDIFTKKLINWKQIGGADEPIIILDHKRSDIERLIFYKYFYGSLLATSSSSLIVNNINEITTNVTKFSGAISYLSYRNLDDKVKTFNIDNIPATTSNIDKGYYPVFRTISIYNTAALEKIYSPKSVNLKNLLHFLFDDEGQELISKSGLKNLSEAEIKLIKEQDQTIKIGVAVPLEGSYIELGRSILNAAKLAVELVNKDGGINGNAVELVVCNDKASVKYALECTNKFIRNKVIGVIGHLTSQSSIEASKIYVKNKIPMLTPASTHPWVTERPDTKGYVFRVIGRDDMQAQLITETIASFKQHHPLKVSIFYNGTIYGSTLASLIENAILKKHEDKVMEITSYRQEQNQYHEYIKGLESNVVVFIGEYGDAAKMIKDLALNSRGDVTLVGADGTFNHKFIDDAGLRAEGAYVVGINLSEDNHLLHEFEHEFKDHFKADVASYSYNTYDATKMLIKAHYCVLEGYNKNISEALQRLSYKGLSGEIKFNEIGDPVNPMLAVYKVQNGNFVKQHIAIHPHDHAKDQHDHKEEHLQLDANHNHKKSHGHTHESHKAHH